jgi:tricorn protease
VIEGERVNDIQPFWLDGQVYFLSDREDKVFNLYRFDPASEALEKITDSETWDLKWVSGHGRHVVYESAGRLHELDLDAGQSRTLDIRISPDLPQRRPGFRNVSNIIQSAMLSPNGKRALITARGEIFTRAGQGRLDPKFEQYRWRARVHCAVVAGR